MDKHFTLLGALYIACSVLGIITGLIVFISVVGGGVLSGDDEAMAITSIVGSSIALFLFFLSVPGLIGAWGLFKRKSWARVLLLILGALNLFAIPFGPFLGIYTFWVLLQEGVADEFSSNGLEPPQAESPPPPPPPPTAGEAG